MENLTGFGIALIQALQTFSPTLDALMKFFSFLSRVEFYLLLIPLIYWNTDSKLGFRLMLVLFFTDFLGTACKNLFRQPRPYWMGDVEGLAEETSYGFVSTHASNSFAVWGLLALHFRKRWLWALSAFMVLMIGISRLYLGVHFPQDVIGGWILGSLVLLVFLRVEPAFTRWIQPRSSVFRVGLGFIVSLLVIVSGLVILAFTSPLNDPETFASFSTRARSLNEYVTLAGALFGTVTGYEMMHRSARFKTSGAWTLQLARYLLGILGVLVLYLGLDILFSMIAAGDSFAGQVLRYLRYAAVTWFVTFGAVRGFLKLQLLESEE